MHHDRILLPPLLPRHRQLEEMGGSEGGASAPSPTSSRAAAKPRTLTESCRVLADVAEPPDMKQVRRGRASARG